MLEALLLIRHGVKPISWVVEEVCRSGRPRCGHRQSDRQSDRQTLASIYQCNYIMTAVSEDLSRRTESLCAIDHVAALDFQIVSKVCRLFGRCSQRQPGRATD